MIKKTFLILAISIPLVVPKIVSAHIKWFVDSPDILSSAHNNIPFYNVASYEVVIWGILVGVAVLLFSILDSYIPVSKSFLSYVYKKEKEIVRIAQIILGLFLVSVSVLWNVILIPEFFVTEGLITYIKYIQIMLGIFFLGNIFPRFASAVLGLGVLGLGYTHGFEVVAENALLLSLCIFFFIKHSPSDSVWNKLDKHAVEIVRIGTGITLIVLAFTEKLMYPELSIAFLDVHHWNFMQGLFPWFTNELFVLSTGFVEIAFGVIFILGYLTRINTVLIASFFAASVVTMAIQFQAWEVEDLVVYAAALLLICYGHGKTKFFHHIWPESWLHKKMF